jgi:hypothetical protein
MTFNKLLMFNEYELVLNYLLKKNIQDRGAMLYRHYKALIKFCFNYYMTDYEARKIFNILTRLGYFEKKKIRNTKRSFEYLFLNPYVEEKKNNKIILYFD